MKKTKDIMSTIVLAIILVIICVLIFYMFLYSGSQSRSTPKHQEKPQQTSSSDSFPLTDTKYKGKSVYVTDSRVKIRSKPQSDATVLEEKSKGDKLIVNGAWGDWFEVIFDSARKGWILREQVSDRKPPTPKIEDSSPAPSSSEEQDKNQTIDQLRANMDNQIAFINQLSIQRFSQEMITGFEIMDGGTKFVVYITKAWYFLPPNQKQLLFLQLARSFELQTCQLGLRTECTTKDYPTISFINPENRQVASVSATNPMQIFE